MKLRKLGALAALPLTVVLFHPLGCSGMYSCEDDATCVDPTIPEGWNGYRWIRVVDDVDAMANPCDDETEPTPYYVGPPDGVQACPSCKAPLPGVNVMCTLPTLECWVGATCDTGKKLTTNIDPAGACRYSDNTNFGVVHCRVNGKPTPPKCDEGDPVQLPRGERLDVCRVHSAIDANCLSDEECVPHDSGAANARQCIFADGLKNSCPLGWDTMYHAYADYDDSRKCSKCDCSIKCGWAGFTISDAGNCYDGPNDPDDTITVIDDTCKEVPDFVIAGRYGVKAKKSPIATVTPIDRTLTGSFQGKDPVTFCCKTTGKQ